MLGYASFFVAVLSLYCKPLLRLKNCMHGKFSKIYILITTFKKKYCHSRARRTFVDKLDVYAR